MKQVNCGEHGTCVNTGGSYECVCKTGYKFVIIDDGERSDGSCVDIDECNTSVYLGIRSNDTANDSPCGSHGDCINEQGSYRYSISIIKDFLKFNQYFLII